MHAILLVLSFCKRTLFKDQFVLAFIFSGVQADNRPPLLGRAPPLLGRAPPLLGEKPSLLGPSPSNSVPYCPGRLAEVEQTSAADDPMNRLEELVQMVTKLG